MNAITEINKVQWVQNSDGVTFRCYGHLQSPLDVDAQKRLGLLASTSRSISGREVKTGAPKA